MSARALRQAVCNSIRAEFDMPDAVCDVEPDGRPNASSGEEFIAVHPGPWVNSTMNNHLDERFGVYVTITRRATFAPNDRPGAIMDEVVSGLEDRALAIRALIHGSYAVMNAANTLITGTTNKFVEPLRFRQGYPLQMRSGEWFFADVEEREAGMSMTLLFGDARRVQAVGEAT